MNQTTLIERFDRYRKSLASQNIVLKVDGDDFVIEATCTHNDVVRCRSKGEVVLLFSTKCIEELGVFAGGVLCGRDKGLTG